MNSDLPDGSHRHGQFPERSCFFCLGMTRQYEAFRYVRDETKGSIYNKWAGVQFVCCPSCAQKGVEYLARHVAQFLTLEEMKEGAGVQRWMKNES